MDDDWEYVRDNNAEYPINLPEERKTTQKKKGNKYI